MEGLTKVMLIEMQNDISNMQIKNFLKTLINECKEINTWKPIETAPKDFSGFLAINSEIDQIEWLTDHNDDERFFNVNSNNFTSRKQWTHWSEIPKFIKN